jgi:hypothetical protein
MRCPFFDRDIDQRKADRQYLSPREMWLRLFEQLSPIYKWTPGGSWKVQDELDLRRSRLLDRRYALSGLTERKDLKDFDWSYNPRMPRRDVLEFYSDEVGQYYSGANIQRVGGFQVDLNWNLVGCSTGRSAAFRAF